MTRTLLLAVLAVSLSACGLTHGGVQATPIPSELTGTVTVTERIALVPGTQLRVRLEETSRSDAPAQFIAETTIPDIGQPPIRFRIALDPRVIDPRRGYTLTARIERGDQLLFINDMPVRVLTGGHPSQVAIVVVAAAGRR